MMRLIDADALWKDFELAPDEWAKGRTIAAYISAAPTIDAVPVVRCKDCRYRKETERVVPHCIISGEQTDEEDFCSWGDRRCDNE